ncbi:MAG: response regulator receiver sensor signal transduction histidine kinase [Bacteroidetes bacterium]|jgi:signal transduction histidine kinase|nr:response regulator receiver sensor signal transduction histidine kinase [Bacteroidota bacterium]
MTDFLQGNNIQGTELADDHSIESPVKILLVDDRKENLLSLSLTLTNLNYTLVEANSGREALKILLKEQDFAIILMDVQMPILNGFETAELIRQSEKLKYIPIIFLTADNKASDNIFKGYKAGAVDYMLKPYIPEVLKAKVEVFVELYKKNKELRIQGEHLRVLNLKLEQRSNDLMRNVQELEKFAYVASHDLQEPLRTITSYIQLLQKKFSNKLDPEAIEFMEFVVNGSKRMKTLINDLLEYSRINSAESKFEKVDCNDILFEVSQNLQNSIKDSDAKIEIENLPVIKANKMHMVQLFQNLIGNSLKFKSERQPVIKVKAKKIEGYYLFSVEDNGIGIKKEYSTKIFEIFQRLHSMQHYPGTGIGLAICMKIVQKLGGEIWMESEYGKGTTFLFTVRAD